MKNLLDQVASIISDYRAGELLAPDANHVSRWINQFAPQVREPLLRETAHVLSQTYLSRTTCENFIDLVAKSVNIAGNDPKSFWRSAHFLRIQQGGRSQVDMLSLFAEALKKNFGISALPNAASDTFIYFDDVSFSGNRILNDLRSWIANSAPATAKVHIIVLAFHTGGQHYAHGELMKAATGAGKSIEFKWWRLAEVQDRKDHTNVSDVLRPASIPNNQQVQAYVSQMRYAPVLRTPGNLGGLSFFSSDAGRDLLEQEFLKAGCRVRQMCPNFPARHRPLGFSFLDTLGFGTMIVTHRNCPNNAPLALWVGNPWIPLFPRKNN